MVVSVITVCFNAVHEIEKTIQSVLCQSYSEIEYIIIDGGSTDGTVDIIRKYTNRITYFMSEPDKGIYDAMNKGLKAATGEWVVFMNAGDTFSSDAILSTVFSDSYHRGIAVIYGDVYMKDSQGDLYLQEARPINFLRRAMPFCHQSSFVRKEAIKEFDLKYKICADYCFFYSLFYDNPNEFYYKSLPISVYDKSHGLSIDRPREHRRENLIIRSKHRDLRWLLDLVKYQVKYNILRLDK